MKTIGLIGGMSWESTQSYYRLLNLGVKEHLGGLHSAKIILYSVDFAPIEAMQRDGKWDEAGKILEDAALSLEKAGANLLLLCTNTMHKVADAIAARCQVPFLHIADATGRAIAAKGQRDIGQLQKRCACHGPADMPPRARGQRGAERPAPSSLRGPAPPQQVAAPPRHV